jgi:hypothetical protein
MTSLAGDITTLDGAGAEEALREVAPAAEFASPCFPNSPIAATVDCVRRGSSAASYRCHRSADWHSPPPHSHVCRKRHWGSSGRSDPQLHPLAAGQAQYPYRTCCRGQGAHSVPAGGGCAAIWSPRRSLCDRWRRATRRLHGLSPRFGEALEAEVAESDGANSIATCPPPLPRPAMTADTMHR